ncbi:MAG: phosphoribosyltransferase [Bdellovibrionota bacterium]
MKAFRNRAEAGRILAERLSGYSSKRPVILALPRGGLPLAAEVATRLNAPLDILAVKKIGAPGHPELAVGAVSEDGIPIFNEELQEYLGISKKYLLEQANEKAEEVASQVASYRKVSPLQHVAGRVVIVVDDGLATGATMSAAVNILKRRGAAEIIVAVPVASVEAYNDLKREADAIISLYLPEFFLSVGQWYQDFSQVSDEEAIAILREHSDSKNNFQDSANL